MVDKRKTAKMIKQFTPKRAKVATMGSEDLEIPNHSGDNSAGTILKTPVNDTDIPNKKYVDDNAVSDHNLLNNLTWSTAGHTIDTDLDMNGNDITGLKYVFSDGNFRFYPNGETGTNNLTFGVLGGKLTFATGAVPFSFQGGVEPGTNNTYDLGSSSLKWKDLYLSGDVNCNSVVLGNGETITNASNGLIVFSDVGEGGNTITFDLDGSYPFITTTGGNGLRIDARLGLSTAPTATDGIFGVFTTSNTSGEYKGINARVTSTSASGTLSTFGFKGEAQNSGTISKMHGIQCAGINLTGGTVTDCIGVKGRAENYTGNTGAITNAYSGYFTAPLKAAGTMTNSYGVYIEGGGEGTTIARALHVNSGNSYFNGDVTATGNLTSKSINTGYNWDGTGESVAFNNVNAPISNNFDNKVIYGSKHYINFEPTDGASADNDLVALNNEIYWNFNPAFKQAEVIGENIDIGGAGGDFTAIYGIKMDLGGSECDNAYGIWMSNISGSADAAYGIVIDEDDIGLTLGAGQDASIFYDGTDLHIDSQVVGSGHIVLDSPKTTTGDPAGVEGKIYWNTIDNVIKMYADGAWRTLASW